jgi:hypothetical protein
MPKKKKSARPAESGWLMATALLSLPALKIGVKRFGLTLSELEEFCRIEAEFEMEQAGYQGRLPWRIDVLLSAGIGKRPDWDDEMEWDRWENLVESFHEELQKENQRRAGKGKDGSGNSRRTFSSWILPRESLLVILGKSVSEYRWKLDKDLRAKSAILASELSAKRNNLRPKVTGSLGLILEQSRENNRTKRAEVLKILEKLDVRMWETRINIAGFKKRLKNFPEKLG